MLLIVETKTGNLAWEKNEWDDWEYLDGKYIVKKGDKIVAVFNEEHVYALYVYEGTKEEFLYQRQAYDPNDLSSHYDEHEYEDTNDNCDNEDECDMWDDDDIMMLKLVKNKGREEDRYHDCSHCSDYNECDRNDKYNICSNTNTNTLTHLCDNNFCGNSCDCGVSCKQYDKCLERYKRSFNYIY